MRAAGAIVLLLFLLDSPLWALPKKVTQAISPEPACMECHKPAARASSPRRLPSRCTVVWIALFVTPMGSASFIDKSLVRCGFLEV